MTAQRCAHCGFHPASPRLSGYCSWDCYEAADDKEADDEEADDKAVDDEEAEDEVAHDKAVDDEMAGHDHVKDERAA
jgi:hypothetical protein